MSAKKKYMICNMGCHDRTLSEMELTKEELNVLIKFATENNKNSKYDCQPQIEIYDNYELDEDGDFENSWELKRLYFHKTTLNYKETKLLLSYIEQLENNRDKAIEFLKTEHMTYDSAWEWRQALINILKGDNDE